jgi:hypothetical protein
MTNKLLEFMCEVNGQTLEFVKHNRYVTEESNGNTYLNVIPVHRFTDSSSPDLSATTISSTKLRYLNTIVDELDLAAHVCVEDGVLMYKVWEIK